MLGIPDTACHRAAAQISLRLDGELSPFEEAELTAHLARCAACSAYARESEAFTSLVRQSPAEPFETPIVMPRSHRLPLRSLQVGAAAASVAAVVGLVGFLGVGRNAGGLSDSLGTSNATPASGVRPAYLDSAQYELRIIRKMNGTHARGGGAVPQ
jgi:anti-sigma factor RsiW